MNLSTEFDCIFSQNTYSKFDQNSSRRVRAVLGPYVGVWDDLGVVGYNEGEDNY